MDAVIVGIDVAKDKLDVAVRPWGERFVVSRDEAGLEALRQRLRELQVAVVGLEATGGYETVVAASLSAAGLPVVVVNPAQVRAFAKAKGKRAKTDPDRRRRHRRFHRGDEAQCSSAAGRGDAPVERPRRAAQPNPGDDRGGAAAQEASPQQTRPPEPLIDCAGEAECFLVARRLEIEGRPEDRERLVERLQDGRSGSLYVHNACRCGNRRAREAPRPSVAQAFARTPGLGDSQSTRARRNAPSGL
jgi:hypothetical protein